MQFVAWQVLPSECGTGLAVQCSKNPGARRKVKILLADDDPERSAALIKVLSVDPGLVILRPRPGQLLADAVTEFSPDIVVVDMARPDRDALDGIRVVTARTPKPIALFVDHDDRAFMEEAISAGVASYHVIEVPPP